MIPRIVILVALVFSTLAYLPQEVAAQELPTVCKTADIDDDNDGLIEICHLEDLNAVRYQLDGSGRRSTPGATLLTTGCRQMGGCNGYELVRDLDFLDDASYSSTTNKIEWTVDDYDESSDTGWQPIGDIDDRFAATFDGNRYISPLPLSANPKFARPTIPC